MKQNYTREEVIELVDLILEMGDVLIDAVTNENTDWDGESVLEQAEGYQTTQKSEGGVN